MVKIKFLDLAAILFLFDSVIIVLMGLLYLVTGTFQSYHIEFTGLTAEDVASFNSNLMILNSTFIRMVGTGVLSAGLFSGLICIFPYRKGEKWAWFSILVGGAIAIIPTLIFTYPVLGSHYMYVLFIIVLIVWIISVILSTYEIFIKK